MTDFQQFSLPPILIESLQYMRFTTPTSIQAAAIPLALKGSDILGSAQTGTGKTAAFAIPLLAKLLTNPRSNALVLTPTRELAVQVLHTIKQLLGKTPPFTIALLIGGESMDKQLKQLKLRPRVIVGTPGRINDHLKRGTLMLHQTNFLVLDETDRMLDMGFSIQIDHILKHLPQERQTLMFSATIPPHITSMVKKYMRNPEHISIGSTSTPVERIKQTLVHTAESDKFVHLKKEVDQREGSIIVFVKTKRGADKLADKLSLHQHQAYAIHGDLKQRERDRVIHGFRQQKYRILVATDIAARGLDIPHIQHVINYDLPQCPEDYIHRIGRTARAGAEGAALCFISPEERHKWKAIHKLIHPGAKAPATDAGASKPSGSKTSPGAKKPARGKRKHRPFSFQKKKAA